MNESPARRPVLQLASCLVLYKIFYLLIVLAVIALLPGYYCKEAYYGNTHWAGTSPDGFARYFETWDTQIYLYLSRFGYQPGSDTCAMFPFWPFCIRAFSYLTGGNLLASAMILSNAASVAALALFHRFVSGRDGNRAADGTLMLMLAFPGALFLFFPYSESLFLLLSVFIFVKLSEEKYGQACAAASLALLTRPFGILWAVPIALHMIAGRRYRALAYLSIIMFGLLGYLAVMYYYTGNALEAFSLQALYKTQPSLARLVDIPGFARALASMDKWHGYQNSVMDRVWFVGFLASLYAVYKKDRAMFAYALVMGLVPAMLNSLTSFTRYALMVVPMFLVASQYFGMPGRERPFRTLLAAMFALQVVLLAWFINFYWAA